MSTISCHSLWVFENVFFCICWMAFWCLCHHLCILSFWISSLSYLANFVDGNTLWLLNCHLLLLVSFPQCFKLFLVLLYHLRPEVWLNEDLKHMIWHSYEELKHLVWHTCRMSAQRLAKTNLILKIYSDVIALSNSWQCWSSPSSSWWSWGEPWEDPFLILGSPGWLCQRSHLVAFQPDYAIYHLLKYHLVFLAIIYVL